MQVKDEFAQDHALDHPLPVFLTGDRQRFEDEHGNSLLIKMSLLVVATIAIGVAMTLALGVPLPKNPFAADTTPADPPAARMISDQSTPPNPAAPPDQSTVQLASTPTADAGQTASIAPTGIAPTSIAPTGSTPAASDAAPTPDAATDSQTAAPASEDLLKQFQSWAATQDSQPPAAPAPSAQSQIDAIRPIQQDESVRPMRDTAPPQAETAQGAPTTRIIQDDPLPPRAVHKHHKPPQTQNARAEIGAPKAARPARAARADARPPLENRPPVDQVPQPTQPPSLLQSLGISRQ